ncbi:DUF6600 domain-containing protein [Candidatus Palauibacter sp.]|uniref:DUF6600 domain-containing protein n=1 Tax=Candidatus Palauibacter sp. TaxID=3101350 RepID=UPI003B01C231
MGSVQTMEDSGWAVRGWGRRRTGLVGLVWAVALAAPPVSAQEGELPADYDAAIAQSGMDGSYGYVRTLEGSATLMQGDTGERVEVSVNEPLLAGDRLFASGESRIEILLADGNIVRAGDRAEVLFSALANSGDTNDPASVIELVRGTLQLVVPADQLGLEFPAVVTPNATIRARGAASFLISTDDGRRSEIIVREGVAEVTTATEVAEVRRGERLFVEGARGERLDFAAAPDLDRLEAWGLGLGNYAGGEYATHVDPDLHYAASSLRGHGSWVRVEAGVAWRPRVSVGWAPYRHGRWRHTPSGLFWVSYEPWGWVPYHYGYWDLHPSWGWVWFPGHRFAGAHVYWYWGPSYAGWIPSGYYWRHYRNYYGSGWGFHFGVYGHIGGSFGRYRHWTFLPHGRLGHRRQHFYSVSGADLGRGRRAIERGVLLTDTRSLGRNAWRRPAETLATLRRAVPRDGRAEVDANGFIDRGTRLPQAIERVALRGRDGRSAVPRRPEASTRASPVTASGERPVRATLRPLEGRSPRLERPSVQRATRSSGEGTGGRAAVRRPAARDASSATRRPVRPVARPTTRSGSAGIQRRPVSVDERFDRTTRRSLLRPEARRSGSTTARPTSRPFTTRPTARPLAPRSTRPVARDMPSTRRPVARPAAPRLPRPMIRSGGASRSGGVVGRSGGSSRSGGAVRRSGGSSRSGGAVRRSGGTSRSSGVARARGRAGG